MEIQVKSLSAEAMQELLAIPESHFIDLKSVEITPAKLTKAVSAFANTSGGEIYVGIEEAVGLSGKERSWRGFADFEAANPVFQVLDQMTPLGNGYHAEFLHEESAYGYVLHLTIFKTKDIIVASDAKVYVRRNAQSLPVLDGAALERLRYDKGVKSFEDELLDVDASEITNSNAVISFLLDVVPSAEPDVWLSKQRVLMNGRPTVAGVLLFADTPQAVLPKRSAVKILRYQTKNDAERDFLAFQPLTIEGPVYSLIYDAIDEVKKVIESIERLGAKGMEKIQYPEEALHEILTNAVLHRDYSVAADVQVRVFDNRVEIESPGRLPGHVTAQNIVETQFARNPQLVRLINKFKNAPNKDVGEGLNTAFEAMNKLRLKKPEIQETDASVVVVLKHESLGSPEQIVMEYLSREPEITNSIGRELTGIKSENTMKQVFYRLRDQGQLEQTPRVVGKRPSWRKVIADAAPANED